MCKTWFMGFLAGGLFGLFQDFFARQTVTTTFGFSSIVMAAVLTLAWKFKPWLPPLRLAVLGVGGFLWGASHHAPTAPQLLEEVKVLRHDLGVGERALIVERGEQAFMAKGFGEKGAMGALLSSKNRGLLHPFNNKFVPQAEQNNEENDSENDDEKGKSWDFVRVLTHSLTALVQYSIAGAPIVLQGWLYTLLLGDFHRLPPAIGQAFRDLGLLHLLVISGSHLTFLSLALRRIVFTAPFLLYALRLINPAQCLMAKSVLEVALFIFLFAFVCMTGQSQAAQRALFVCAVGSLSLLFCGQLPLQSRLFLVAALQSLVFPIGFLSESNLMSWAAYLTVLRAEPASFLPKLKKRLLQQTALFFLVGAFWGEASLLGIPFNLVVTPIFDYLFLFSVLLLATPYLPACIVLLNEKVHALFFAVVVVCDRFTREALPFTLLANLPHGLRVLFLTLAALFFLKTFRDLSIREVDKGEGSFYDVSAALGGKIGAHSR